VAAVIVSGLATGHCFKFVVCSFVLSESIEPFMWDLGSAATLYHLQCQDKARNGVATPTTLFEGFANSKGSADKY